MRRTVAILEYIVAVLMLIGGVNTAEQVPTKDPANIFALVFDTHSALILFGITFFICGAALLYGRIKKKPQVRQPVLMTVFCLMLFATLADMILVGLNSLVWLDSVFIGAVAGICHFMEARWITQEKMEIESAGNLTEGGC